jgi:hypothetical protein
MGECAMTRLFWKVFAPMMILIIGAGGLFFALYPHCFIIRGYKMVMSGGAPVQGAGCFTNGASETELILIPGKKLTDYLVYSVDLQGEVAGLLDKHEILFRFPGGVLVWNANIYGKPIERQIYEPHEIGHDPSQYHITDESARRIDVLYVPGRRAQEPSWEKLLQTLLRYIFLIVMLIGAPLFITVGWLALRRNGDTEGHRRVAFLVVIIATIDWLLLAAAVRANLFFPSFRSIETWVGLGVSTVCVLASIAGTGGFRRPMTYLSMALMLTWFVVASFPI